MKRSNTATRIFLLIAGLLATGYLEAQETEISDIVRIHLPPGATRLPKQELRSIALERKLDTLLLLPFDASGECYSIDSCILFLHGERRIEPANYLENRQRDLSGLFRTDGMKINQVFQTRKINNYSVLLTNVDSRDWGSWLFSSVNRRNNAILNGELLYSTSHGADKMKASKLLNDLLIGISYVL